MKKSVLASMPCLHYNWHSNHRIAKSHSHVPSPPRVTGQWRTYTAGLVKDGKRLWQAVPLGYDPH